MEKSRFVFAALAVVAFSTAEAVEFRQRIVRGAPADALPSGGESWAEAFGKDHLGYWWNKHCKAHPEFFARRPDGKRLPWGAPDNAAEIDLMKQWGKDRKMWNCLKEVTLCVTADGLVDALIDDWVKDGKPAVLGCADSVRRFVCTCDKCKALDGPRPADANDEEPDWYSDRYVNLANRVLAAARKLRPDVRVSITAKFCTLRPPHHEKLADGVSVVLTPTFFDAAHLDPLLAGWQKAGMKDFYCRCSIRSYYDVSFYPLGNEKFYYDFAKKMADAGCIGFDLIGGADGPFVEHASRVVAGYLMKPECSFADIEKNVCARFGKGAKEAAAYFAFFRDIRAKRLDSAFAAFCAKGELMPAGIIAGNPSAYFTEADFVAAGKMLKSKEVAVLATWNENARLTLKAINEKSRENSVALLRFRDSNGLQIFAGSERREDGSDICGLRPVLDELYATVQDRPIPRGAEPNFDGKYFASCRKTVKSSVDGSFEPVYFHVSRRVYGRRIPLVVALHSWSYPNTAAKDFFLDIVKLVDKLGGAVLAPNFRGPNNRPEACGSDLAVQDIVDAVEWAKGEAPIDDDRIYIIGGSGGGHMALLMAGRHPEIWAGVSAFCPITDCARWYVDSLARGSRYAGMLRQSCGGSPADRADEYAYRSPVTWLERAKNRNVPVYIVTGIHDGHTGSVPIGHAIRGFNELCRAEDRVGEADIAFAEQNEKMPEALVYKGPADPFYSAEKFIHFRRTSANVRLTICEGGHTGNFSAGMDFLYRQVKNRPVDWTIPAKIEGEALFREITK